MARIAAYGGWERCLHLSNGRIELVATLEVGPRVLRCGFTGGANEFAEIPADRGRTGDPEWRPYGGHRLWRAPEDRHLTWVPDNAAVQHVLTDSGAVLIQPPEPETGLQKILEIALSADSAAVLVTHRLRNRGQQPMRLAAWAMSVMAPGGEALLPHPLPVPFPAQLLPNRALVLWPYTSMDDARAVWGRRLLRIRQDAACAGPLKVGLTVSDGWVAYRNGDRVFLKRFAFEPGAVYPDFGCSAEAYTDATMLELESLSPLVTLAAGETLTHVEHWSLHQEAWPVEEERLHARLAELGQRAASAHTQPLSGGDVANQGIPPGR